MQQEEPASRPILREVALAQVGSNVIRSDHNDTYRGDDQNESFNEFAQGVFHAVKNGAKAVETSSVYILRQKY